MVREELSERVVYELRKQPRDTKGGRAPDRRISLHTDLTQVWPVRDRWKDLQGWSIMNKGEDQGG